MRLRSARMWESRAREYICTLIMCLTLCSVVRTCLSFQLRRSDGLTQIRRRLAETGTPFTTEFTDGAILLRHCLSLVLTCQPVAGLPCPCHVMMGNLHAGGMAAYKTLELNKGSANQSVAICLVVRNQDIKEWVDHHRTIGMHHPTH
jgi:hypothetical protein